MHYYQFNISDYRRDTVHLSHEEHYIYRALIDIYYESEQPLVLDHRRLLRLLSCTSDQFEMLDNVLSDFFVETEKGYKHPRIEAELAKIYQKSDKARESANKRWEKHANASETDANAMRTHSEGNAKGMLPIDLKPNNLKPNTTTTSKPAVSTGNGQVPFEQIINKWNDFADKQHLPRVVKVTTTLKGQIRQRWKDMPKLENWDNFFQAIGQNDFLAGRAPPGIGRSKPFRSTLVWVTKEGNFAKIAAEEYE